jgi:hypothetical protein
MKMNLKRDKESSRKSQDVLTPRKSIMLRVCATIVITCLVERAWRPNVHILENLIMLKTCVKTVILTHTTSQSERKGKIRKMKKSSRRIKSKKLMRIERPSEIL